MKTYRLTHTSLHRATILYVAGVTLLACPPPQLNAQCSSDGGADSFGCELQQTAPSSSSPSSSGSPTVLTMEQQTQRSTPQPDRSSESSADNSLSNGSSYTEQGPRDGNRERISRRRQPLPPDETTEFQRFVAATTGRMLPIYGSRLFSAQRANFGPIDQGPAPETMVVGAGDELRIRVWGQINFSANLRVSREGEIYLPKAGAVHVAGLAFSSIGPQLRTALERVYRNFELSVDLGEIHTIQVYVTGMARVPGEYAVSALSTLVDAVFLSGGPSGAGSMRHIQLKRVDRVVTDFDLYALLVEGDKTGDAQLQPGDVIFIPAAGPEVALLGSVRLGAIFELRGTESIGELLQTAGGKTAVASGGSISVDRIVDHSQRRSVAVANDSTGLATTLADGDIVRLDPVLSSFRETVTLRGSVANPGRFRWHDGMRLSELIPDRESLMTRDYWWRRTELGLPAPEFDRAARNEERSGEPAAVSSPGAQTDWNYAVVERVDPVTMSTSLLPFNLGRLVLDHDSSQDLNLKPGDVVTIFSQDEIHPPTDEQTKYVQLQGEFVHAGIYSVSPGETLRSLVARAGGLSSKAYLYGSEFTRKSTLAIEQQQLNEYANRFEHQEARSAAERNATSGGESRTETERQGQSSLLDREMATRLRAFRPKGRIVLNLSPYSMGEAALPEIALEDGDRLLVPHTPATIQVIGAVSNQNAFLYHRDARVGEYLHLAGGATRSADQGESFVLRADGSVVGRGKGQSIFSGSGFEKLRLYPGDTIVVPEKSVRPSMMRAWLDWTQMFSQIALGAAAVNAIK